MIIATALFFYMTFVSLTALLIGRFVIRCMYYLWLFLNLGGGHVAVFGSLLSKDVLRSTEVNVVNSKLRADTFLSKLRESIKNEGATEKVWEVKDEKQTTSNSAISPGAAVAETPNHCDSLPYPHRKKIPSLIAFQRPFRRVLKCAILLSATLCLLYAHCWSRSLSAFKVSREEGASFVCQGVFLPLVILGSSSISPDDNNCHANHSCVNEKSIWIFWAVAIMGHLFYYSMHEFSGKHHKGYQPPKSIYLQKTYAASKLRSNQAISFDLSRSRTNVTFHDVYSDHSGGSHSGDLLRWSSFIDDGRSSESDYEDHDDVGDEEEKVPWSSLSATIQKFSKSKQERPKGALAMVPWYSIMLVSSGFDILVSLHIFLGRFDARKMQVALLNDKVKDGGHKHGTLHHQKCNSLDSEGVFDFSHCRTHFHDRASVEEEGNGFWFDFVADCGDGFNSSYQISRLLAQPTLKVATPNASKSGLMRTLRRGKVLVLGGDLAYPDPTPDSYEKRLFRTFEDAMPPPPSFRKEHISIRKPALPVKEWKLDVGTTERRSVEDDEGDEEKKSSNDHPHVSNSSGGNEGQLSSYGGPCAFAIPGNEAARLWLDLCFAVPGCELVSKLKSQFFCAHIAALDAWRVFVSHGFNSISCEFSIFDLLRFFI